MKKWYGSAAICVNEENKLLMVKQGTPDEPKRWSVPSGGKKAGETFETCCVREVKEETGYEIQIDQLMTVKKDTIPGYEVEVHYFKAKVIGGNRSIQDPDGLIYEIDWKASDEIKTLDLSYPEDKEWLLSILNV